MGAWCTYQRSCAAGKVSADEAMSRSATTLSRKIGALRSCRQLALFTMEAMVSDAAFDLSYRPKSYWLFSDPAKKELATVNGERMRFTAAADAAGLSPSAYIASVAPGEGPCIGASPAALISGQFLPPSHRGEVEIARIAYESTLGDVVSVRARWFRGKIRYRITDDFVGDRNKYPYGFAPRSSVEPLTMGELIGIIDEVVDPWADGRAGLVLSFVEEMYRRDGAEPDDCMRFVNVTSPVYPRLGAWYRKALRDWRNERAAEARRRQREDRRREVLARRAARQAERKQDRLIAASPPKAPWDLLPEQDIQTLGRVDLGLVEKWLRGVPGFGDATITIGCQRYGHPMRRMSKIRYMHFDWSHDGVKHWLEVGPGTVRDAFRKLGVRSPAVADLLAGRCT